MDTHEIRMTLVPLSDDEVRQYGLTDVVALYVDSKSGVINVGRPSLAPYYPALANMFGFNSALEKGYYLVLKEKVEFSDKQIYSVNISSVHTVLSVSRLKLEANWLKSDNLLENYLINEEKKKIRK